MPPPYCHPADRAQSGFSLREALALHRALRRMAGLVFLLFFLGADGRLPKARRGRVFIVQFITIIL